jgi:hypothetical protein
MPFVKRFLFTQRIGRNSGLMENQLCTANSAHQEKRFKSGEANEM